ncbi:hypothetical protein Zmor_025551 [Zophobas morio]|uniref:Uncharacterized protein n=1 Tax=Zophobas morio TaxID=2755281 RepID=A0AA38HTP7_9CUCU|nr:hypothetical protein Zmor_025551 [Zophobas morio]
MSGPGLSWEFVGSPPDIRRTVVRLIETGVRKKKFPICPGCLGPLQGRGSVKRDARKRFLSAHRLFVYSSSTPFARVFLDFP